MKHKSDQLSQTETQFSENKDSEKGHTENGEYLCFYSQKKINVSCEVLLKHHNECPQIGIFTKVNPQPSLTPWNS